jgi:hypothetical protein
MGLLGVARANTAVGVSPETFLLLLEKTPEFSCCYFYYYYLWHSTWISCPFSPN